MAIYMHYDGIKGDVSEGPHKEWIQLNSISFAAHREAKTAIGQAHQRQGGPVSICDIMVTKPVCHGSAHLFDASVLGEGKKVKIDITRSGVKHQTNYLEIILEDCCVSNYQVSSDGVSHNEVLTLNFVKIEMTHKGAKENLSPDSKHQSVKFNIATGAAA
jgi:type VI secretion system secreted protein Hcp